MPRARTAAAEKPTRTLLVEEQGGNKFRIEIPADYKVTFGSPGGNRSYGPGELRIYEADTKQRACFVGVKSFRDLGLPMTRLVISETGAETWESDGEGNTTRTTRRNRSVREVAG